MVSDNDKKLVKEWKEFLFSDFKSTKRALWLARAERAKAESIVCDSYNEYNEKHLWESIERKCREKAEEYR